MFTHYFTKISLISIIVLSSIFPAVQASEKVKVGFVYAGPIGDHGWAYQHNQGRLAVEHAFGDKVETLYLENVLPGKSAQSAFEKLANQGVSLIFTTSLAI